MLADGGLHEPRVLVAARAREAELVTARAAPGVRERRRAPERVGRRVLAPRGRRRQHHALLGDVAGDAAHPERAHLGGRRFEARRFGRVAVLAEAGGLRGEGGDERAVGGGEVMAGPRPGSGLVVVTGHARLACGDRGLAPPSPWAGLGSEVRRRGRAFAGARREEGDHREGTRAHFTRRTGPWRAPS